MRLLIALTFVALTSTNSFSQESPLDDLTVTSTRLKGLSGFAEVTYGYRRGTSAANTQLDFVVIQTSEHSLRFRNSFHLNNKVDDVTPPAYLVMDEHTVDLPNEDQVHEVSHSEGRYRQADSDITLAEIRAWLDQPDLLATVDSLLDYKASMRTGDAAFAGETKRAAANEIWHGLAPQMATEKHSTNEDAIGLQTFSNGSVQTALPAPNASEVTLRFDCASTTKIRRIRVEILPDTRFPDGRLGRNPERKELMLFDIEARIAGEDGNLKRTEWLSCTISKDSREPDNTDGGNLIDAASDTGWSIPKEANADDLPYAILTFPGIIVTPANGCFLLSFDVGGHPDFDTPARYRVSFSSE